MQYWPLLVLLSNLIFFPAAKAAGSLYDELNSTQKDYWLKLLHYSNGQSRADGEQFFASPIGKTNPAAELQADIDLFKNPNALAGWFHYHPQCVYRGRYEFLKQLGFLAGVREETCREFHEWKTGLNAESVTLIFSSSYPNNPSSLFGHTLLRLNQKGKEKKSPGDLLDYAVAFSAMPEKEDLGIVFAAKGLFGGYKGLLEITKYYTKVMEYNNGESRDLIEYDLKTTPEELDKLISHLWEIYQTTYFDYFFADENCSSVLSDILAVPFHLDHVNDHKRWYYLPAEMIKTFKESNRVISENFRPSLKKQLERRLEKMSGEEVSEVKKIFYSLDLPPNYDNERSLDSLISLVDFTRYRTKDKLTPEQKVFMRKALLRRSVLSQGKEEAPELYEQNHRPDKGHGTQKISFFLRSENASALLGLEIKQGYHDLMSRDDGYDAFSQFDFLTGSFVYSKQKKTLTYDKLYLVDLVSLHSYTFYDPQFSWAAKFGAERLYDLKCELCHKFNAKAYLGPTLKPKTDLALSLMAGVFGELSDHFQKGFRAGSGVEASILYQLNSETKIGLFDEMRFNAIRKIREDYYNQLSGKFSYFIGLNSEWRLESILVSRYGSFTKETWVNQLNFGHFF